MTFLYFASCIIKLIRKKVDRVMLKYFRGSFLVTIIGLIIGYLWAEHSHPGSGFLALFIVIFLSILEVTLSFDNAVINAMKLEKMDNKWRHRFLTWGIAIAVFGMRFLFPIIVVAAFSGLTIMGLSVLNFAPFATAASICAFTSEAVFATVSYSLM